MSLRGLVVAAFAELHASDVSPVHACGHVIDQAPDVDTGAPPRLIMCAQHPRAGIMCADCLLVHVERHPATRPCDECGREGVSLIGRSVELPVRGGLALAHPSLGEALVLAGDVVLTGVVVCSACATADPTVGVDAG